MNMLVAIFISLLLLIGAGFTLVGSIGLLKLKDGMSRLHAPTKVGTLGIGALLLASLVHAAYFGDGSYHELLIMAFLFVTAPISAHFIAKVHIHHDNCQTLPQPPRDDTWSTLDIPEEDRHIAEPAED